MGLCSHSCTLLSEWKSPLGKFSSLASSLISAAPVLMKVTSVIKRPQLTSHKLMAVGLQSPSRTVTAARNRMWRCKDNRIHPGLISSHKNHFIGDQSSVVHALYLHSPNHQRTARMQHCAAQASSPLGPLCGPVSRSLPCRQVAPTSSEGRLPL